MEFTQLEKLICERVSAILADKGTPQKGISGDTVLLGGIGLDSLDLAGIVVELQESTGLDPFAERFVEFRTVRELAALFQE